MVSNEFGHFSEYRGLPEPPGGLMGLHVKEICPSGNNKVLFISLYHDKCLLFMLELY